MTIYPEALDTDLELPRIDENVTEISGDAINSLRDAVFAIERAIGIDPQGHAASLVARINNVIDADGNIKTSALASRGLVTLPITNAHVGDNAAIEESKLDLDFTTAFLKGRVDSNAIDIAAVEDSLNAFAAQTSLHFTGDGDRHDGYQIDILDSIRGVDDVESALHQVNNAFTQHENTVVNVHAAAGISVNNEFQTISAENVQDALVELDNANVGVIDIHQDAMHDNAAVINVRGHQGDQGNLSETILASTIYQTDITEATNILQVMRPNVARVTSKNIDPRSLSIGVSQNLRIAAGGLNRSPLDVNLSSIIPTEDIDTIVSKINETARTEHYPISSYNTGGKLTIAHNLPGEQFTIQISDAVSFPAAEALGFGDVVSTVFEWSDNHHSAYVGGKKILDLKTLLDISHTHGSASATIAPGLGDLSAFGLDNDNTGGGAGRVLCHITNHDTDSTANGTYYITTYPTTSTFVLNEIIPAGVFDLEIVADSTNFINSSNGEIFDIFLEDVVDGYAAVTKSKRVAYGPIAGVSIRAVSNTFPDQGMEWQITDATYIKFIQDGDDGEIVTIPAGFQGHLKVYAPDNINSAIIEVTGNPGSSAQTITMTPFAETDDSLYISSVHYSGNFGTSVLKFVTDKRKIGGSVENKTENKLSPLPFEESIKDLRNNGIVRGFEFVSSGSSSFTVRGGRAYVDGRKLDVPTKEIVVTDFSPANKLLLLDRDGNYIIKDEFDPGYSFAELTQGEDSYGDHLGLATILEFSTDGASITPDGYFTDRRLMIGKIDKRILDKIGGLNQRVAEIENTVAGNFWGNIDAYQDGNISNITLATNPGLTALDEVGFAGGNNLVTTRRFEVIDTWTATNHTMFRALGASHINVFVEVRYSGQGGGAFGTSGEFTLQIGSSFDVGLDSVTTTEDYAIVKTIDDDVLPSNSVKERYVISVPLDVVGVPTHAFFDIRPRVKITGSTYADGGSGGDVNPIIQIFNMRIVTSSYSIAGNILGDSTNQTLATTIGDVL